VKPGQAASLFRLLTAAYPRTKVEAETTELWLTELRQFDFSLGGQAVRSLLAVSTFWPSLAEFQEQVTVAREQAARTRRSQEREQAERAVDELPRPPLREVPAVAELMGRWYPAEASGLAEAVGGPCEQCGKPSQPRYVLGKFTLCRDCVRSRRKAEGGPSGTGERRERGRREPKLSLGDRRDRRPSTDCHLCGRRLLHREQAEGFCDGCLKGRPGQVFAGEGGKNDDAAEAAGEEDA
jgi:hypothetical protein